MKLKNFITFLFATLLPMVVYATNDIRTIGEDFPELKSYSITDKMENLTPLLVGETIRFSDFKPNQDIIMFEYEVPDTV